MDDGDDRDDGAEAGGTPTPAPTPAPTDPPRRAPRRAPGRPRRAPATPPAPAPPLDEATARAVSRLVGTFILLILASIATTPLPLPWRLGSTAFTVAALAVGIRALRLAQRSGARDQLSLVLMFGVAFAVLTGLSMVQTLIIWPVEIAHQECLRDALTIRATAVCESTYEDAVQERVNEIIGRP